MSSAAWVGGALLVLPAVYTALMLRLRRAWEALPVVEPTEPQALAAEPLFSVLVAARNEAENLPNLLRDLAQQRLAPAASRYSLPTTIPPMPLLKW
ncbi:hypothetical protein [Hymenobacter cellulosilyticus]|uniref:Glycosyltransferase n=1 Tax=Hymenobacter cellulosilyticus TaxID=2932248 RepID=A0A8T9Q4X6_9BACT|nr:hypothetical protein [Hymenobacter cellulosilyticus]UOQ70143.1 hypothetical protein MUN79_15360 [Hymenobacter cellulosilyticus]